MKFYMPISIKISRKSVFLAQISLERFLFLPINIEMRTVVGILTFMSRKNSMLAELSMKMFYNLGAPSTTIAVPFTFRKVDKCYIL